MTRLLPCATTVVYDMPGGSSQQDDVPGLEARVGGLGMLMDAVNHVP